MKISIITLVLILLISFPGANSFSSNAQKKEVIILKGKVLDCKGCIPTSSDEEVVYQELTYKFVKYKVIKVVHGKYEEDTILVAEHVGFGKGPDVGSEICLRVQRTNIFEEKKKFAEEIGLFYDTDWLPQYVYAGRNVEFSCSK